MWVGLAAGALAAATPSSSAALLLDPSRLDPALIVPPPPATGSEQAIAEIAELHAVERATAPELRVRAQTDGKIKTVALFADIVGPGFVIERLPATMALFATVRREEKAAVDGAKHHFARDRPWVADPSLASCARSDEPGSSYPSGHASMAFAMAGILARLLPAHAPAILSRAAWYARERVLCEQHFPSDVAAGQTFGTIIAERLMQQPAFERAFDEAAAELRRSGLR